MSESTSQTSGQADCGCTGGKPTAGAPMPQVTFSTFVLSLYSSAMVHLGEVPEPESGQSIQDLDMAKHTIDSLAMLKEKTANCLDDAESKLLADLLYELRVNYCAKIK